MRLLEPVAGKSVDVIRRQFQQHSSHPPSRAPARRKHSCARLAPAARRRISGVLEWRLSVRALARFATASGLPSDALPSPPRASTLSHSDWPRVVTSRYNELYFDRSIPRERARRVFAARRKEVVRREDGEFRERRGELGRHEERNLRERSRY